MIFWVIFTVFLSLFCSGALSGETKVTVHLCDPKQDNDMLLPTLISAVVALGIGFFAYS